ncbi:MAG: HAD hydrolase-like protein [Candidatus Gracilibacteria bacterium]
MPNSILQYKKYFLLDLDGTLYRGSKLFPYTKKFIKTLRDSGRKPIFLSNNSSKSTAEYLQKLNKIGLAPKEDEIYTSLNATIEYLQQQGLRRIFLMATPEVEREFVEAGFELIKLDEENKTQNSLNKPENSHESVRAHTHSSQSSKKSTAHNAQRPDPEMSSAISFFKESSARSKALPQAVVLTFDTTFNYQKFCIAYDYIMAGVPFYATHPDTLVPTTDGFHPDIGTLLNAFETAFSATNQAKEGDATKARATTRKPVIIGKPQPIIYQQLQKRLKCTKNEMIMIGDRLYTDIKGANDYGITSALVLSGETTLKMAKKSQVKPELILKNIGEIINF